MRLGPGAGGDTPVAAQAERPWVPGHLIPEAALPAHAVPGAGLSPIIGPPAPLGPESRMGVLPLRVG